MIGGMDTAQEQQITSSSDDTLQISTEDVLETLKKATQQYMAIISKVRVIELESMSIK